MSILSIILQSILSLGIFSVLYKMLISKGTNFNQIRFFILFAIVLSIVLPFIEIKLFEGSNNYLVILDEISIIPNPDGNEFIAPAEASFSWQYILKLAFATAATFFLSAFCIKLLSLKKLLGNRKHSSIAKNVKLIETEENINSFSFFNTILIKKSLDENTKKAIIKHELEHIRNYHSFDKIIIEFLSTLLWFNPFYWIFRRELHIIHEFQADAESIKHTNKVSYMQMLLSLASIKQSNILINNFNQSFIKRRFKMITKEKVSKGQIPKFLLTISLTLCVGFLIACSNKDEQINKPESQTIVAEELEQPETKADIPENNPDKDPVFRVVEVMPEFPGGTDKLMEFIRNNIKYPKEALKEGAEGTSFVSFVVMKDGSIEEVKILRGFNEACDAEAVRVVSSMPKWDPGKQRGKPVNVEFNLPIKFKLDKKKE